MILTIAKLAELGACVEALERLEAIFGSGPIEVTEALCVAHADYNWNWAARHLLEPAAQDEYYRSTALAQAVFDRTQESAWENYALIQESAWVICDHIVAPAFAVFDRTPDPAAQAVYDGIAGPARDDYARVDGEAFAVYVSICAAAGDDFDRVCAAAFGKLAEAQP